MFEQIESFSINNRANYCRFKNTKTKSIFKYVALEGGRRLWHSYHKLYHTLCVPDLGFFTIVVFHMTTGHNMQLEEQNLTVKDLSEPKKKQCFLDTENEVNLHLISSSCVCNWKLKLFPDSWLGNLVGSATSSSAYPLQHDSYDWWKVTKTILFYIVFDN